MNIIHVSSKHRIVITKDVRKSVPIEIGQQVLEIPVGDFILIIPLPRKSDNILRKYLDKHLFGRKLRRQAESKMLKEASNLGIRR